MKVSQVFSLIHDHENADARSEKYEIFRVILDNKLVDKEEFLSVIHAFPEICGVVADKHDDLESLEVYKNLMEIFTYPEIQKEYAEDLEAMFEEIEEAEESDEDYEEDEDEEETEPLVQKVIIEHQTSQSTTISTLHFVMTCFTAAMTVVNTIGLIAVLQKHNI